MNKLEFAKLYEIDIFDEKTEKTILLYRLSKTGNLNFKGTVIDFLVNSITYKTVYGTKSKTKYDESLIIIDKVKDRSFIQSFNLKKSLIFHEKQFIKKELQEEIKNFIKNLDLSELEKPYKEKIVNLEKEERELFRNEFLVNLRRKEEK